MQEDDEELDAEYARERKIIRVPLALSIVAICFFWPTGIAALVYAIRADQDLRNRRYRQARLACDQARTSAYVSIAIPTVVISVVVLAFMKSR